MRKFILVANALLALLWLVLVIGSRRPGQGYATDSLHGMLVFIVLPSFAIGLWGRLLPLGIALTVISLAMFLSFVVFAVNY